uniref:Uncharacterized protein n=1 Tax=Desulfovibrio sp. U5L TaxID=596152 RepID=I2Q045_9BACT
MTYSQSAHIIDLQARNTELVSQVRTLTRALADRGPAISAVLCAHHQAVEKHQQFPAALDAQGTILAEELLEAMAELNGAGLAVLRAINDHRDEAPCLDRVREEYAHVGAVVLRALEKLAGAKGQGKP